MTPGSGSILNYSDYRSYLKSRYQDLRSQNRRFSFGTWSRRLGLKASSGLIMIINGQRNPGPALTETLIRDLRLSSREASFFRDLVCLEKCRSKPREKTLVMARLASLHPRKQFREIEAKKFRAVSNWYFSVIRELVDLPDFRESPQWIQSRLRVFLPLREIQEALATLVQLGMLERDEHGKLRYRAFVATSFDVPDEGLRRYHGQMLALAQKSLHELGPSEREISGMTLTLRRKDLDRAKEILRRAYQDLVVLAQEPGDEVFQLELALFPLTKSENA